MSLVDERHLPLLRVPMRTCMRIGMALAAAYMLIFAAAYVFQRELMYFPDRTRTSPNEAGLSEFAELELRAVDGERIIAWHGQAAAGQPTLLYLHGNSGSLSARRHRFAHFKREGWGVFAPTWRGYGGSSGAPSERVNVADAILAYDALRERGIAANDIIVYGESLGSGVAVQLATQRPVSAVVLDAPYTSTVDIAAITYPFLPVRWAMHDRYESVRYISRIRAPLLIVHGERDTIIPIRFGRALYDLANEPKQFVTFPEGRHVDLFLHGEMDVLRSFVREIRPRKHAASTSE